MLLVFVLFYVSGFSKQRNKSRYVHVKKLLGYFLMHRIRNSRLATCQLPLTALKKKKENRHWCTNASNVLYASAFERSVTYATLPQLSRGQHRWPLHRCYIQGRLDNSSSSSAEKVTARSYIVPVNLIQLYRPKTRPLFTDGQTFSDLLSGFRVHKKNTVLYWFLVLL